MYVFAYTSTNKKYTKRKRDITVAIYGEALPEGVEYKPHTEIMEETLPGEPEITSDRKMFIGEEVVTAEARSRFVIDVYIDRFVNGELQESIFMYKDIYQLVSYVRLFFVYLFSFLLLSLFHQNHMEIFYFLTLYKYKVLISYMYIYKHFLYLFLYFQYVL